MAPRDGEPPGLLYALQRLAGTSVALLRSRLELASLEVGEAQERFVLTLVAGIAAGLLFVAALTALSAWAALAAWDRLGPSVLGLLALVYAVLGIAVLVWLRARLRSAPPLLADTLDELRQDAQRLRGGAD
ncbi:MAG: phage holin family protein [Betaproteobacteria bacterium]